MFEIIQAGGWLMLPLFICSVVAMTIIIERFWSLRRSRVLPTPLLEALREAATGTFKVDDERRRQALASPLGKIVSAALLNRNRGREVVKESVEDTGRQVVHDLERYLNTLGTIAAITPLLGLLGTVFGMIEVFTVISAQGTGDTQLLAGGISQALITTAAGLAVAIPSLLFYRYFRGKVDELVVNMEEQAIRLINLMTKAKSRAAPATGQTQDQGQDHDSGTESVSVSGSGQHAA